MAPDELQVGAVCPGCGEFAPRVVTGGGDLPLGRNDHDDASYRDLQRGSEARRIDDVAVRVVGYRCSYRFQRRGSGTGAPASSSGEVRRHDATTPRQQQ